MDDVKWVCQMCGETRESKRTMAAHLKYQHGLKQVRTNKTTEITLKGRVLATTKNQLVIIF